MTRAAGISFFAVLFIFSIHCAYARMSEERKIEHLIASVANAPEGVRFIRNGKAYSAEEAAGHLRTKYKYGRKYAATAQLFIENIASKSSFTGTEYRIALVDGTIMTAHEFFTAELKKIEKHDAAAQGKN